MVDKIIITGYRLYTRKEDKLFTFNNVTPPYVAFYVPLEQYEIHNKGESAQYRTSFDVYMEELTHDFLKSKNIKADIIGYVQDEYSKLNDEQKWEIVGYTVRVTLSNIEHKEHLPIEDKDKLDFNKIYDKYKEANPEWLEKWDQLVWGQDNNKKVHLEVNLTPKTANNLCETLKRCDNSNSDDIINQLIEGFIEYFVE